VVKEGTHIAEGVKYAIKVANLSKSPSLEQEILSELSLLSKISHPNIVFLKEFFDTPKTTFIVMERFAPSLSYFFAELPCTQKKLFRSFSLFKDELT